MSAPDSPSRRRPRLLAWFGPDFLGTLLETAAAAFLLAEAVALLALAARLPGWLQAGLWLQWLLVAVLLRRAGMLHLFGPVCFYDLVTAARRRRHFLVRTLFAAGLLALLCWYYSYWAARGERLAVRTGQATRFAETFFFTYMSAQFALVLLLTPAYVAGAIAEEKSRRTLEFLLATDLRDREIVFGKLASRLANLGTLLLAGLPVLGFLQFLGGIDPGLVLAGFAATALTLAGVAGLSIFHSVLLRRARDAILLTYVVVLAYLIVSTLVMSLPIPFWLGRLPGADVWLNPTVLQYAIDGLCAGNVFLALGQLTRTVESGGRISDVLPSLLLSYALFHGPLAVLFPLWATLRLRTVAAREAQAAGRSRRRRRSVERPPIGDQPMVWKEYYVEAGRQMHWLGRLLLWLLVALSFLPVILIVPRHLESRTYDDLGRAMNVWVRGVGTAVACLLLLGVGVHAAGTVTGERERQTFDGLLTSPLDSNDILWGKWIGSVVSVRWGWLWLGAIYVLGVLSGGLNLFGLLLSALAWGVFAAFAAGVGLWMSAVNRTSLRASVGTLLLLLGVSFGHWLLCLCCVPVMMAGGASGGRGMETLLMFQAFGLTPPATLAFLAFHGEEFRHINDFTGEALACSLVGLVGWGIASGFLYGTVAERFRELTGRLPLRRSERPPAAAAE